jgi:hypothetical protein
MLSMVFFLKLRGVTYPLAYYGTNFQKYNRASSYSVGALVTMRLEGILGRPPG